MVERQRTANWAGQRWNGIQTPQPRQPETVHKLLVRSELTEALLADSCGLAGHDMTATLATLVHVVQVGETFLSVATHYGVSVLDLLEANDGIDPDLLYAGQRRAIP